ncbi:VanW family protein [Deinococcus hopiensis]|uniref:Vancomycin resistance protein YoaR, contains peptidoglycan-binding and VanW domains n=1 Tax=Deinococcus hopiensis KR-140 TaxID=695939 RepID=A0A1W1UBD0_9DEIO|nr:VanW family protein [Deinococcus hopiensis]SMB78342.1 Vancomycin resistance protein YoaR, contains peptidoglycan-binding and VanW domains [Deinococcus hopiensis KR-140]
MRAASVLRDLAALLVLQTWAAQAQPVTQITLRLSAPEPLMTAGQVQRPLLHRSFSLRVGTVGLKGLTPQLNRIYARVEARRPREIRFSRSGDQWVARAQTGWKVDRAATEAQLRRALARGQMTSPVVVRLQAPARSVRWAHAQGLRHLAGEQTRFTGSPAFRVQNIRLGSARIHGTWVAPGQAFDFNARVGQITPARGFAAGYVILGPTLSLEPGGGICQVSTTVFRAAYRAGLPITERHPHSYQVAYYGTPGLDAAVYAPTKNLRWLNDTARPILVQASWDLQRQSLRVDLFGRPDGRRVWVGAPHVSDTRLPAPPTYVAEQAMGLGETRRIDMPASGARVSVVRQVRYPDGRLRRLETGSVYRPWGGVFAVHPQDPRLR